MSTTAAESYQFEAEVTQLMKLMIHSLYSNKEIFLRELISNASDACDKRRFLALQDPKLGSADETPLQIEISVDEQAQCLTVSDAGIGMGREELIANLGTIAKSGTQQFLAAMTGDQAKDAQLIGQFGVGFYSCFMVAESVRVVTRRADATDAWCWTSQGAGEYQIEPAEREAAGTDVILQLNDEAKEFLEAFRLRAIIKRYSDHIAFPIRMLKQETKDEDAPATEAVQLEWETINQASALWTRAKRDISDEEYQEFYKHIAHDFDVPLAWTHNKVEGKQEYTSLLYLPKRAPFDLWQRDFRKGLSLYVQRVFIMDEADALMPAYLRFVRGLVDSNDLPLNVSRELLQENKLVDNIRSASTRKILELLQDLADKNTEDYQSFWDELGAVLKEGLAEDHANQERILKLLRFASTHDNQAQQTVSLDTYIQRMPLSQEKIYYLTAESFAAASNSPHLEIFRDKGIEVLLLYDRVDEWALSHVREFADKGFASITKGDVDLGDSEDSTTKQSADAEQAKPLLERIKRCLDDKVDEVKVSSRLTTSPACLVTREHEMSLHMQKLMQQAGHNLPASKPILEINPGHPVLLRMEAEQDEQSFGDWAALLVDQALLAEGGQLEDPASFVRRMNKMFTELAEIPAATPQ